MDDKVIELIIRRLDSIDSNLQEHMRRTDILEQLHLDNDKRITVLEAPIKARKYAINTIVDITKFTGFVLSVLAILRYFGKI